MLKRFLKFIQEENLVDSSNKILLGVSGGIDSVVMLDLFSKSGFNIGISHCNFGLRGQESDEDNSFVELLAQKYDVPFYAKKLDTYNHAKDQSISIQMAARDLRVNWFEEIKFNHGYNYYATAHHLDDQIETILNNFFRGTGISGLHGILPKCDNLIHPMLFCFREQIETYANQYQIEYRVDSSNKKTKYTRNQIRHQLIPVIKNIYPNYQKTITDNIQRLKQVENIYKDQIQNEFGKFLETKNEYLKLPVKKLRNLQDSETYLYEVIKHYGFNYTNSANIILSIDSSSGKCFLSDTHKITKDRDYLIIEKRNNNEQREFKIEKDKNILLDPIKLKIHSQDISSSFKISKNQNIAEVDSAKLKYPLVLRKWGKGDFFYPLGMDQKKLLSDFFIDNKVSVPDKERTWILTSDKQIVWIIGHRIDNRFKITESTINILAIECI